jgi:hypothetical protein
MMLRLIYQVFIREPTKTINYFLQGASFCFNNDWFNFILRDKITKYALGLDVNCFFIIDDRMQKQ